MRSKVDLVRNAAVLLVIVGACVVNSFDLDVVPLWRQVVFVVLAVAGYLHGRHLPVRHGWVVFALAAVPGVVDLAIYAGRGIGTLVLLAVFVGLPWLAGRFRRQQAELIESGRKRVAQMEREQEFVAERARLRERARIASDMHDSLGNDLALIALRAGSLELAADATEANRQAAAELRATAVQATDRLRQTIGMLREKTSETLTPPDEPVEALVDRARGAGMDVLLRRGGEPLGIPSTVDRAAYRVVQEALTNAARYARGAQVVVRIDREPEELVVVVHNTAVDAAPMVSGSGSGLLALAERVGLLGGTFRAAPEQGFTVTARLPCPAESAWPPMKEKL
ncbi:Signal transduction histidine kinase [Saccharopolyspora antimicrobica]|uniref:histidine kinase n=1 Tax=Saccharopolyspora antimicrobica TaxID=455193 RepID=A0A1I5IVY6_9PSEU|nr:signal transduction histidine kinase [Saccharopolyspora antimicrobica]SFO64744.1 Signal transduction histidine kinase [Saccharopolyspora antimicrobica]